MDAKVVFMGTPDFAVPALKATVDQVGPGNLVVVTQPDRKAGRGRTLLAPPVKTAAEDLGVRVLQTDSMKNVAVREMLVASAPDLIIVAAFGLILPSWLLNLPTAGCVNLHASDLPRFRGASPVAAAIAMGDSHTAISLMEMEKGLDTGAVLARAEIDITAAATTASLTSELGELGAELLQRSLVPLLNGDMQSEAQAGAIIETRKIEKAHGAIDWRLPAVDLERHVRAMWSWPRAWTDNATGERLQIHRSDVNENGCSAEPGTVIEHDDRGIVIATGEGALRLLTVQLAGKPPRDATQLYQHPSFSVGSLMRMPHTAEPARPWIIEAGTT